MSSVLGVEPALVGRNREINRLNQLLDSALTGKGATVFIGGEAGVGKTRLVNEFLSQVRETGITVLSGWCLSEAAIPYFPFTEAFNTYLSTKRDEKVKSTVTTPLGIMGWLKGPQSPREPNTRELLLDPRSERDRTFETVAQVFLQLSASVPLILFLDDLQWADPLSLALIHYLARKCRNARLLIIGTYRLEEIVPTKEEGLHPLQETMFSMSREDLSTAMELNRLTRDDLPELLRSIFHSSIGEEFIEKLYMETEGNPLFMLETLNMLLAEGFLIDKEGLWVLTASIEKIGIPSKVNDVILRRLSRLGREERKLLDLAAVCGHSFSIDMLRETLALDITDVLERLIELEQRHKLVRSIDSTFEFTHRKIREVVFENVHRELRRVYHLETARYLEQVLFDKLSDGNLANIAHHYVEGGAPDKAFEYLVTLGEKALSVFANTQAIDYLTTALDATRKTPSLATSENLFKIYKFRGRAWTTEEEYPHPRAKSDFTLMLQQATSIGDESLLAEAHWMSTHTYNPYNVNAGARSERMRHLTTALELARKTGNKPLEGKALFGIGMTFFAKSDSRDESLHWFEEALKINRETGDIITESSITDRFGQYHNWKGEYNRAKDYLNRAIALLEEMKGIFTWRYTRLFHLSIVLTHLGEYNEAISTGQRCLQITREYGAVEPESWVLNTLGWIYHQLSHIELAIKYNNESLECARAHKREVASGGVPYAFSNLGADYLYKHDYETAARYFKEAWRTIQLHGAEIRRLEARLLLGDGEVSLAKGDYTQALKNAEDALALSKTAGFKKYIAKGLKLKAETLAEMGNLREAIEQMGKSLNLAQQMGTPHLLWHIHYSYGILFDKCGKHHEAKEHYTEAMNLIEATASKLNDPLLANTLLLSPHTKAIRDAYSKTNP